MTNRQPPGTPRGGQFAPSAHGEPDQSRLKGDLATKPFQVTAYVQDVPHEDYGWGAVDHGEPPQVGDETPYWGQVKHSMQVAPGVHKVIAVRPDGNTHTCYKLSGPRNAVVAPEQRMLHGWYETYAIGEVAPDVVVHPQRKVRTWDEWQSDNGDSRP